MRFSHTNRYAASPERVLAMLTDPAFREQVCAYQRALEHSVDVRGAGPGATVEVRQTQSMDGAPGFATKIVGSSVGIVQTERWTSADSAEFAMEIPGKPGHLRGRISLRALGEDDCEEVFTGEVKVGIPLVAGKIEKLIGDVLARGLRREGRVGRSWLEGGEPDDYR